MKIYTLTKVKSESLKYFKGDELAATTWMHKYALQNADGAFVEASPDAMHQRMAKAFYRIETKAKNRKSKAIKSDYGINRKALTQSAIYKYF